MLVVASSVVNHSMRPEMIHAVGRAYAR